MYNDETFEVRKRVNEASTWDQATNAIKPNLSKGSILSQSKADVQTFYFRNQLNFNRLFGKLHEVNFAAGVETSDKLTKGYAYPTSYGYNDNTLSVGSFPNGPGGSFFPLKNWMGNSLSFGYTNSFSERTDRFFSLYGNLSYTFNKKYTLSGSARTDASNLITDDPAYRYAPFWSVGGLWNVKSENFMNSVHWLNSLKFRITYGYNGNVDRSTAFRPLLSLGSSPNVYTQEIIASISSFGNPTLRWEKTGTLNLGLDFSMLENSLFGKIEAYKKTGTDLLASIAIPAINGTSNQKLNNAEMVNRGIELTLGTQLKLKGNDILWKGSMNIFYNDNKITKLFKTDYRPFMLTAGNVNSYVVGYNANTYWSYEYLGIRESDKQPIIKGPGNNVFAMSATTSGDGRDFLMKMGTRVAPYGFGFNTGFKVYDFDVSMVLTGKFGYKFRRSTFNYSNRTPNNKLSEVQNGDPNKIVPLPLNDAEPLYYRWTNNIPYLNYLATNASHFRLQEVNLNYNISPKLLQLLRLKGNISIYAQGNNLFTILANKYNEDPEYPVGSLKPMPQYTFGAKINF
ncbi:MAG: hypothetical protein E6Q95_03140 [Chitinophagaceae bacterium]|nr:MAG: hypothetical protein E6Q95_03140 [Chitinophagaceae bacterium]